MKRLRRHDGSGTVKGSYYRDLRYYRDSRYYRDLLSSFTTSAVVSRERAKHPNVRENRLPRGEETHGKPFSLSFACFPRFIIAAKNTVRDYRFCRGFAVFGIFLF